MTRFKRILPYLILLASLGLLAVGLWNGGFADVLNKARMICYECIGIG
ncbi:MAG: hypothetical protein K6G60_08265 [Lachnospiraceae bacterium]|nr:hypothetical protein [Lachnospiraceae bacterium]